MICTAHTQANGHFIKIERTDANAKNVMVLFHAGLCSVDGCNQNPFQLDAIILKRLCHFLGNVVRKREQSQPVFRFGSFFQSDMQFRHEIRLTLSVIRLIDVRTDRGSAAHNLFRNNRFFTLIRYW